MKNFEDMKRKQLEMKDASSIGCWDAKISKLCGKMNRSKNYYTTSSCSGRVILIRVQEKKGEGLFLFRSHEKIRFPMLKKELEKAKEKTKEMVDFRQESSILHVACKTLKDAQVLLDKAKLAGWKNSGIIASNNRIICQLLSTERIELPILKGEVLVSDDFLKILVKEANRKLERVWGKIEKLEKLI